MIKERENKRNKRNYVRRIFIWLFWLSNDASLLLILTSTIAPHGTRFSMAVEKMGIQIK